MSVVVQSIRCTVRRGSDFTGLSFAVASFSFAGHSNVYSFVTLRHSEACNAYRYNPANEKNVPSAYKQYDFISAHPAPAP